MPYPPNQYVANFTVFNGGTPGTRVTAGQYALDWLTSLGGSAVLTNNNTTFNIVMPFLADGTPAPIPDALNALLQNVRQSFIGALRGVQYPPLPPIDSDSDYDGD